MAFNLMKKDLKENKRGLTLGTMAFGLLLIVLLVTLVNVEVLERMNDIYNESYESKIDASDIRGTMENSSKSSLEALNEKVEESDEGLTLSSAWAIGKGMITTLSSIVTLGFLSEVGSEMRIPSMVTTTLSLLLILSLIILVLKIFLGRSVK